MALFGRAQVAFRGVRLNDLGRKEQPQTYQAQSTHLSQYYYSKCNPSMSLGILLTPFENAIFQDAFPSANARTANFLKGFRNETVPYQKSTVLFLIKSLELAIVFLMLF